VHALAALELAFRPDRVEAQGTKFKAALADFLSGPRNASGVTPASMASAVSLKLHALPQAHGVLPAIAPIGPDPVEPLPGQPTDGPACRVTVEPAGRGRLLHRAAAARHVLRAQGRARAVRGRHDARRCCAATGSTTPCRAPPSACASTRCRRWTPARAGRDTAVDLP
jgi:hypothetical protein